MKNPGRDQKIINPKMNGKQRIDAALNGEWPDKRPVLLHNFLMAVKEYGVSMKTYREDPEVVAKGLNSRPSRRR